MCINVNISMHCASIKITMYSDLNNFSIYFKCLKIQRIKYSMMYMMSVGISVIGEHYTLCA